MVYIEHLESSFPPYSTEPESLLHIVPILASDTMYPKTLYFISLALACRLGTVLALPARGVIEVTEPSHGDDTTGEMLGEHQEADRGEDGKPETPEANPLITFQPLKISGDYKGHYADLSVHKGGGGKFYSASVNS